MYIACVNCRWRDVIADFVKYDVEDGVGGMIWKVRCVRCQWHGEIKFPVQVTTTREGRRV